MNEFLATAVEAATLAGSKIAALTHRKAGTKLKKGRDIVSEADLLAQDIITKTIRKRFPEDRILAEEAGIRSASCADRTWIVDPLDGTVNFVAGIPFWSVSVAVRIGETTVAGAVFAPALNELFTAALGSPASLNNVPIRPSDTRQLDAATVSVVLTSNYDPQTAEVALGWISRLAPKTRGVRIFVSEALELCYLACGRLDANLCPSSGFFSAAAASLIADEAGCTVTSLGGDPYQTGKSKNIVAAANAELHAELMLLLTGEGVR